ncbi:hypothetical protein AaE_005698 [Aphanomyces astaci]|uniref:EF-hand domain-containing protein n=1 Tax=Aphanomyces astaci TaxID=112090 RepID=A0A6A5ANB3_APHAT|nr:hypothetical protein AaE_005698 [Aphanomyces astaci]
MDVVFELADKDNDGMLSGAEFLGALESFECFTASEKEQIRQSLTKRDKSISLGDLRGLYESAIESEWKNIFHHPVEGIPKAKAQVIAKVENSTKPSVIKTSQKTKTTKVPATTAPKDVVCMMTEEQLDRLIDAIPQFKGPSKSNKAEVVKATQAEPRKPVALYKPSKVKDLVTEAPPKSKTTFIREAIPLALQAMTETMQMSLQRGGDGNHSGIWLTSEELDGVVDAFLATTSTFESAAASLVAVPPLDACEQLLTTLATCHLCLTDGSEFWCCNCSTALCAQCLHDVCCKQLHHHVEVYIPVSNLSTPAVTSNAMRPRGDKPRKLAEKQLELAFVPLAAGPALQAQLTTTHLAGCDSKTLKQFCMLLRKQIEMQPMCKVTLGFLDRTCITQWSPDDLRCFLDVIHVPSAVLAEQNVTGDHFLRLSVPALHDTYGIVGSFPLHRCLFYRSLLSFVDQWIRSHPPVKPVQRVAVTAVVVAPVKPKPKKKLKPTAFVWGPPPDDVVPINQTSRLTTSSRVKHNHTATNTNNPARASDQNLLGRHFNEPINPPRPSKPPAQTKPPTVVLPSALSPVKKLHSSVDEDLVQLMQDEMKDVRTINAATPATSAVSSLAPRKPVPSQQSMLHLQQTMTDLVQRLEVAQSLPTSDDSVLTHIDVANTLVQRLLHMAPQELESKHLVESLDALVREIESKLQRLPRHTTSRNRKASAMAPVQLRETKYMNKWVFQIPEPAAPPVSTATAPGPSDYDTDSHRAFPMHQPTKQPHVSQKPMSDATRVQTMLSDLGFDMTNTTTTPNTRTNKSTRKATVTTASHEQTSLDESPPPFDIDEFVADETGGPANVQRHDHAASRLYSTSFLDDPVAPQNIGHSTWQRLRRKQAAPLESVHVSDAMAEMYDGAKVVVPSMVKVKPPKSVKAVKTKTTPRAKTERVADDVAGATDLAKDTNPTPTPVAAGNAVNWAKRIQALYTPLH